MSPKQVQFCSTSTSIQHKWNATVEHLDDNWIIQNSCNNHMAIQKLIKAQLASLWLVFIGYMIVCDL